jgi:hypothetical protein
MKIALTQRYVISYAEVRVCLRRGTSCLTQKYVVFTQRYVFVYAEVRHILRTGTWFLTHNCVVTYAEVRGVNGVGDTVLAPVLLFCQRYTLVLCTLTDRG